MAEASDADVCAICLGGMLRGQASFVAECSHAFHLSCISASVAHGNHDCPLCKASWTVLPAVNAPRRSLVPRPPPAARTLTRRAYEDDEPVQESTVRTQAAATTDRAALVLRTHCECPAVAKGAARENFAVLVHAKAPSAVAASDAARAPIDLVTVLDVSGSMRGPKLELLKQAMGFVIDNLGPADRLSVVSFSDQATRVIRLTRTSDAGKAAAKRAVTSLVARGGTNIGEGLRVAAQVLDDCRQRNAVASIMLLSDGRDAVTPGGGRNSANYINLVPSSPHLRRRPGAGDRSSAAVHTFGFGADHDSAAMHTIAEATNGTFSFVEDEAVVQDSFAQCIGGLLTVAMQEARIAVTCLHPDVRIREVKSGRYGNRVDASGRAASVDVGELYADEERRFLIFVDLPAAAADDGVTGLVKVSCTYRDAATGQAANVAGDDAVVQRPAEVAGVETSMEVERERVRVAATEDMAAARVAADRGDHAEAARILRSRLHVLERSAPGAAGDPTYTALMEELRELISRVADRREYETTGRACFLSGMSSHRQQRAGGSMCKGRGRGAGARGGCRGSQAYLTPTMEKMVKMSREHRQTTAPSQIPKREQPGPGGQSEPRKRHKYL